jgi:hypothetical protein
MPSCFAASMSTELNPAQRSATCLMPERVQDFKGGAVGAVVNENANGPRIFGGHGGLRAEPELQETPVDRGIRGPA